MDNKKKDIKYYIKEYLPYILVIIFVLVFKQFYFAPIMVNGVSMENTLLENDIMILDKYSLRHTSIKRFDIVVIDYKGKYLIKRVIGLPGDKVEYKDNKLYINDEYLREDFLTDGTITKDFSLEKVPDDFYFVLGDHREVSNDSRYLGCFSYEKILGKTDLTIFPFDRLGTKK